MEFWSGLELKPLFDCPLLALRASLQKLLSESEGKLQQLQSAPALQATAACTRCDESHAKIEDILFEAMEKSKQFFGK